mmetsp:Transcript_47593/g.149091  ORF Transcript_47593/g.149091 Transcript_47593/m.149091 type:complete len:245 (-) Transcript_47593:414-1148(-)
MRRATAASLSWRPPATRQGLWAPSTASPWLRPLRPWWRRSRWPRPAQTPTSRSSSPAGASTPAAGLCWSRSRRTRARGCWSSSTRAGTRATSAQSSGRSRTPSSPARAGASRRLQRWWPRGQQSQCSSTSSSTCSGRWIRLRRRHFWRGGASRRIRPPWTCCTGCTRPCGCASCRSLRPPTTRRTSSGSSAASRPLWPRLQPGMAPTASLRSRRPPCTRVPPSQRMRWPLRASSRRHRAGRQVL